MQKNPSRKLLLLTPLLLLPLIALGAFVGAQQAGQGLEVSPPSQELRANPGDKLLIKSTIRNRSNNTLPIKVRIEDFMAVGEQGQVELLEESTYSVKSWSKVSPNTFKLGPGEDQEVQATINIPLDAAGGRYGSFVFGVEGKGGPNDTALTQEIASLFLIKLSGPVSEKLTLLSFSAPSFSEFGPIPFHMKLKSDGNVHSTIYGLVNVTDMFNRKVSDIVIQPTNIFPGSIRIVSTGLDKKVLIGKYTAIATLYYGTEKNESLNSTLTFYVFPIRIAIGAAILILFIYLIRKRLKKAFKALLG